MQILCQSTWHDNCYCKVYARYITLSIRGWEWGHGGPSCGKLPPLFIPARNQKFLLPFIFLTIIGGYVYKSNLKCWQIYGNLLMHEPFGVISRIDTHYTVNIVDLAIYFKTTTERMHQTIKKMEELGLITELKFHPVKKRRLEHLCTFSIFLPITGSGAMSILTKRSSNYTE